MKQMDTGEMVAKMTLRGLTRMDLTLRSRVFRSNAVNRVRGRQVTTGKWNRLLCHGEAYPEGRDMVPVNLTINLPDDVPEGYEPPIDRDAQLLVTDFKSSRWEGGVLQLEAYSRNVFVLIDGEMPE